jgi:hypothetical protein
MLIQPDLLLLFLSFHLNLKTQVFLRLRVYNGLHILSHVYLFIHWEIRHKIIFKNLGTSTAYFDAFLWRVRQLVNYLVRVNILICSYKWLRNSFVILILENCDLWSCILRGANHFLREQYSKSIFFLLGKSSFWFLIERSYCVGMSCCHRELVLVQIFWCYGLFVLMVRLAVSVYHLQVILVGMKLNLVALNFLNNLNFVLVFLAFYLELDLLVVSRILNNIIIFRWTTYLIVLKLNCCCGVLISV